MLPTVTPTLRRKATAVMVALALTLTAAAPAQALGRNERNVLAGVAGTLLVTTVIRNANERQRQQNLRPQYQYQPQFQEPQHRPRRHFQQQPVYQPQPAYRPAPISIYQTPAAVAFNSYAPQQRRIIQARLAQMGYYRSGIDGAFGPGTYNAVAAYARDIGAGDRLASRDRAFGIYDGLIY